MNKQKTITIHTLVWTLIFVFFWWAIWSEGNENSFLKITAILLSAIITFYGHYFLLKFFFRKKQFLRYLAGLVSLFGLVPLLMGVFFSFGQIPAKFSRYSYIEELLSFLPYIIFLIIISSLFRLTEIKIDNLLRRKETEKQAIKAELNYLKSQINPHFLFNTLNNIHTLAYKRSPLTAVAIAKISSLMRYMIYESNSPYVELEKEVAYLYNFIDLQQLRYKNSPVVKFCVEGNIKDIQIAPLLFIPLVENAYMHSDSLLEQESIIIDLKVEEKLLVFRIKNPLNVEYPIGREEGGFGLENLKKRLSLIYQDNFFLKVIETGEAFEVLLKLKFK